MTALQPAVAEKTIRINGRVHWLYAVVDPATDEFLHTRLFPITTQQTTRWVPADLHRRNKLNGVTVLVDHADHLLKVLRADGYRLQVLRHVNPTSIERVFREVQRRT